ncbi:superoxide dismutase [Streptomyces sp. NPDC004610]|uniref:SMP-30/gluconolactonase/LRE family protein n=1 Tax=unclassified Streptomyces TaxID=2593676 RepID=UPI0033ABFDD7
MTTRTTPPARTTRRALLTGLAGLTGAALTAATTGTATAAPAPTPPPASWPTEFPLPDGFLPEGITIGSRPYAYMGSRANGAVLRTDLRTGQGEILHPGTPGTATIGLKLDGDGTLYLAGGAGGTARLVDARTGALRTTHTLTTATPAFINDVVLTGDRAWFTDSRNPVLYGVPRGRSTAGVRALPLTGDWVQIPDINNANGIVATPDGKDLIVVQSNPGALYRISLRTGAARRFTLTGAESVLYGDGLVRVGSTLYVVQNRHNLVSVWDLDLTRTRATLRRTITDPRFDVPATAARFGNRLYLVNARFTSPQLPSTTFTGVGVPL